MAHSMPVPVSPTDAPGRMGRTIRVAVHAHRAAHRLGNHVEAQIICVRALRREALDLGEDQTRIDLAEPRVVEAQLRESARRHVLDEDVRLLDHPPQQRLAFVGLEIRSDAALVEIVVDEIMGVGVGTVAQSPAPRLAAIGLFHLDDNVGPDYHASASCARWACLDWVRSRTLIPFNAGAVPDVVSRLAALSCMVFHSCLTDERLVRDFAPPATILHPLDAGRGDLAAASM